MSPADQHICTHCIMQYPFSPRTQQDEVLPQSSTYQLLYNLQTSEQQIRPFSNLCNCDAGRNKWHMAAGFSDNAPAAIPLSPEAVETARRAYSAGAASQLCMSVQFFISTALSCLLMPVWIMAVQTCSMWYKRGMFRVSGAPAPIKSVPAMTHTWMAAAGRMHRPLAAWVLSGCVLYH